MIKPGSQVIVLGKLDQKIRSKGNDVLVKGTVDQVSGDTVTVILPDGELWTGDKKQVRLASEQE